MHQFVVGRSDYRPPKPSGIPILRRVPPIGKEPKDQDRPEMTASRVGSKTPKFGFESFFIIPIFQGLFFSLAAPSTPLRTCFARDSSYESLTSLLLLSRSADEARYVIFHHRLAALILDPLTVAHDTSTSRRHYFCVENFDVDLNRIVHFDGAE